MTGANLTPEEAFNSIDDALQRNAFEEAFRLAAPWAEVGYGWAEACIGTLYQCGLGVVKSREEAICYLERAAKHGFPGAWYSLAVMYEVGDEGVLPNAEQACKCYEKARNLGYSPGKPFLVLP